jgi:hypothetical protein
MTIAIRQAHQKVLLFEDFERFEQPLHDHGRNRQPQGKPGFLKSRIIRTALRPFSPEEQVYPKSLI